MQSRCHASHESAIACPSALSLSREVGARLLNCSSSIRVFEMNNIVQVVRVTVCLLENLVLFESRHETLLAFLQRATPSKITTCSRPLCQAKWLLIVCLAMESRKAPPCRSPQGELKTIDCFV